MDSSITPMEILKMNLDKVLPDAPRGPLDVFRRKGSFDWRKLKVLIESEDAVRYKSYLYELIRNDPLFEHPNEAPSADKYKHLTNKRMFAWERKDILPDVMVEKNPLIYLALPEVVQLYDASFSVKLGVSFRMYSSTIKALGTDEQFKKYALPVLSGHSTGCFALTEIAHGSNAKGMRTTATFQPDTKDFILHTPDFESAKCWVGNLGKTACQAVVYAQLVSKGKHYGLHSFVVSIRCPKTLKPYTGVTVGDLGEKLGLNGIDNGFIMFDNYRLPFDSQLARVGGINTDGDYVNIFKDPSRRFGASFAILSTGRVNIGGLTAVNLQKGVVIATRYAAIRKQFSDSSNATEETPIIEYQSVQTRLMPYLSATFVLKTFGIWFSSLNAKMVHGMINDSKYSLAEYGMEVHALSSATKPVCSWLARDGLQMCRELCAGHGYLKAAGIGDIRNDNDANCTYEGENHVLIQQTINWLISIWNKRSDPKTFDTPLKTVFYLKDADKILQQKGNFKNAEEAVQIKNILNAYKWLVTYMLKSTAQRFDALNKETNDSTKSKNDIQSYYGIPTAIAFAEHYILERALGLITEMGPSNETRVLLNLLTLFGAWLLDKHLGTLYMGGYWSDSKSGQHLREAIIGLCKEVSTEAVLLVDILAPPDFILNSVLGASDGQMYKNLQKKVFTAPGAISRPEWWQDVINWKAYVSAKL